MVISSSGAPRPPPPTTKIIQALLYPSLGHSVPLTPPPPTAWWDADVDAYLCPARRLQAAEQQPQNKKLFGDLVVGTVRCNKMCPGGIGRSVGSIHVTKQTRPKTTPDEPPRRSFIHPVPPPPPSPALPPPSTARNNRRPPVPVHHCICSSMQGPKQ